MAVLPERNLPGSANEWGRAVENRVQSLDTGLSRTVSTADNNGRFVGGQLSVQGGQIQEQLHRTTLMSTPGDLSVTGNRTIEPFPRASRVFSFANPGGARIAQVEIYANYSNSNFGNVSLFAYLSFEGSIISKLVWRGVSDSVDSSVAMSGPLEAFGLAYVTLPSSAPATFTLTTVRVGFTSTTTTETLTNIRSYLTPFQKTV